MAERIEPWRRKSVYDRYSGFAAELLATYEVSYRGSDEEGRERTGDNAEEHCEDEAADGVAAEDEDAQEDEYGRE